jgi:polyisoprenoid-binding protein YceI
MRGTRSLVLPLLLGLTLPVAAQQLPIPNGTLKEGTLSFDGHASVGDFTGSTLTVAGQLQGAPQLASVQGWVEAPVNTLKTGKDRRDRDLNKSMESEKYPVVRFELSQVEPETGTTDSLPAKLHGRLILHGITQEVTLPASLSFLEDGVRARSSFPVNLKDYQIGGLSKMLGVLKMDEHIVVHVDLTFQYAE